MNGKRLLTAEELADRLAVSECTVKTWAREGRIPVIACSPRIRRFEVEAVMAALHARDEVQHDSAR